MTLVVTISLIATEMVVVNGFSGEVRICGVSKRLIFMVRVTFIV